MDRFRSFSLVFYNVDEVLSVIKCHPVKSFYYIAHDKDDGKDLHYHGVVLLDNACTFTAFSKWFDQCIENVFVEATRKVPSAIRYLIHYDNEDKYQYNFNDIVVLGDSRRLFSAFSVDSCEYDSAFLALNDLCNGVDLFDISRTYGRDFIYHYGQLKCLYDDIRKVVVSHEKEISEE